PAARPKFFTPGAVTPTPADDPEDPHEVRRFRSHGPWHDPPRPTIRRKTVADGGIRPGRFSCVSRGRASLHATGHLAVARRLSRFRGATHAPLALRAAGLHAGHASSPAGAGRNLHARPT